MKRFLFFVLVVAIVGPGGMMRVGHRSALAQSDTNTVISGTRVETKVQPLDELPVWPRVTAKNLPPKFPPMFPSMGVGNRPGATKIFENEKIIVWDDVFGDVPVWHRHTRDIWAIHVDHGDTRNWGPDGSDRINKPTTDEHDQANPGVHAGAFVPAGMGPHAETAADPKKRRHLIWVELKGTEPADCRNWSTDPLCK